jgi:hypothetical protein
MDNPHAKLLNTVIARYKENVQRLDGNRREKFQQNFDERSRYSPRYM